VELPVSLAEVRIEQLVRAAAEGVEQRRVAFDGDRGGDASSHTIRV
jgi:hypothetical protein